VPLLDAYVMASVCGTDANYCIAVLRRWRTLDHMESTTITVEPSERDSIDQRDAWYHACMHHQRTLLPALFRGTVPHHVPGRSTEYCAAGNQTRAKSAARKVRHPDMN
jgi:hypothetical protein